MLSEVKERLEGPKYNMDFRGEGVGVDRVRGYKVHYAKRGILRNCLNTFVPHCSLKKKKKKNQIADAGFNYYQYLFPSDLILCRFVCLF